jgi:dGTPase
VAQIARTVARQLRLDEDLAECLALAHDLGHSPFGHAGERALDAAMKKYGGFDHNAQSLRVVMSLERKYLGFDGLNLTWETLEGLAKHNGPIDAVQESAVRKVIAKLETWQSLLPRDWASAEAQVASLSDDIAYLNHDIDDGLRAGLITLDDIKSAPLVGEAATSAAERSGGRTSGRVIYEVTRRVITEMVRDVVATSRERLAALQPRSPTDIRAAGRAVVAFSPAAIKDVQKLKSFLFERVYRHPRVMSVMGNAESIVGNLFARYFDDESALPEAWRMAAGGLDERRRARVIADFVAGMTDRYAIAEHQRLFDATPELR